MFVAIDLIDDRAVTGIELHNDESRPELRTDYRCLFCDSILGYMDSSRQFEYFTHPGNKPCINDGNVSDSHRLAQEVVAKEIVNRLPIDYRLIEIDLERHVGVGSKFIIADIRVTEPIRLAVEVVYLSPGLDLQRRLRTLFAQEYAGMIIVVTDGVMSPRRINRHLHKVSDVQVGRFDPRSVELQFGSVITSDQIDPDSDNWDHVPACLS